LDTSYDILPNTMNFDTTNGQHGPKLGCVNTLEMGDSQIEYIRLQRVSCSIHTRVKYILDILTTNMPRKPTLIIIQLIVEQIKSTLCAFSRSIHNLKKSCQIAHFYIHFTLKITF